MCLCLNNFLCSCLGLCGSKNYPYLPRGRDFSLDPHPPPPPLTSLEIPVELHTFTKFIHVFGPLRIPPPPPREFSIPSVAGVWLFSGTTQFWSQLNESWMGTGYTFTIFHSTSVIVIIALHSKI